MTRAARAGPGPAPGAGRGLPREGLLLLAAITLFWGLNWPAIKLSVAEVPIWTYRSICVMTGGLGLLAICRIGGIPLRIPRGQVRPLLAVAFFNTTLWYLCSAAALVYMEAGRGSIVAYTMPLWATLLAVPLLGERLRPIAILGLLVGLAGLGVLVLPDWRALIAAPLGILLMLAAAIFWAVGTIGLKYVAWSMPTAALAGWQLLLGGLPMVAGALLFDTGFKPGTVSATAWLAILYSALVAMLFCQWAWFRVVALFPASVASIGTMAIPVVGVLSSAVVLGEGIELHTLLALALVCLALALVLLTPRAMNDPTGARRTR